MLTHLTPSLQKRALPISVAAWHGMVRDGLAPRRAELIRGVMREKLSKSFIPLSVAAWHTMIRDGLAPARAELIRGVIIEKMSKSPLHVHLCHALLERCQEALSAGHWIRKEDPLTLADSELEPDISIVPGKHQDYKEHPTTALLVIEVAVSTLAEDRGMAEVYAGAGVDEFWIVNAPGQCIEVYRQPGPGGYAEMKTYRAGQSITCASLPVTVDVGALFREVEAPEK